MFKQTIKTLYFTCISAATVFANPSITEPSSENLRSFAANDSLIMAYSVNTIEKQMIQIVEAAKEKIFDENSIFYFSKVAQDGNKNLRFNQILDCSYDLVRALGEASNLTEARSTITDVLWKSAKPSISAELANFLKNMIGVLFSCEKIETKLNAYNREELQLWPYLNNSIRQNCHNITAMMKKPPLRDSFFKIKKK